MFCMILEAIVPVLFERKYIHLCKQIQQLLIIYNLGF